MKKNQILLVSVIFFWFAQYVYIPYQTPYLTSLQVGSGFIGIIIGTYGFSQMILRLPVGICADLQNRHKSLIIIGASCSGFASLFRMVLNNGMGYFIGNIFSGIASAMWISFMVLYMSFFSKEDQQKATGQIVMANNIGMLAGFITSTVLYEVIGMRMICLFSIISGLIAALFATQLPKGENKQVSLSVKDCLKVCFDKQLIVFSLFALVQQGVQISTTMSYTTQIIKDLGYNSALVGIGSIIYMCSAVLFAKLASTSFCIKTGSKKWIPFSFLMIGLYCLLIPHCQSILPIYLLQIIPGISTGILFSFCTSEAMKNIPLDKKSSAMGFYQAVYALGMTTFPMICSQILSSYSMAYAYYFLMILCVLSMFLSILYYKFHKKSS